MPGGGEAGDDTGCGDIGYIMVNSICHIGGNVIYCQQGEPYSHRRLYPSSLFLEGSSSPPDERKEGDRMYVTYADLFQFCIFICALVGLCYTIFKGKKK